MNNNISVKIDLPNPWRTKAGGKILRHVPISLYADDTSGNISKRWNKHLSFYFTLSGLPPNLSNQEFNCHFLATSNRAGVLELAEIIVDELNDLATNGFEAYDAAISEPVFVMTSVLFFLGDSPMHSKITNTPYPGSALNPCRICTLSAPSLAAKHRKDFMYKFLHLDRHGNVTRNRPRVWLETVKQTHKLFKVATEDTIAAFDTLSKEYGVKDWINEKFIEQQGIAEVKAKIDDLKANKFSRLFNPFLRLIFSAGLLCDLALMGFTGHTITASGTSSQWIRNLASTLESGGVKLPVNVGDACGKVFAAPGFRGMINSLLVYSIDFTVA
ncbi:uncharacterized protein PGTG_22817 [Puccinia graminis f. sp. tritici CRL 75-36-700-3]|uniref:Uncharacterized protein n=1 Tax=Puccinia graminis f. sp. tritici (strain CRL 75-36-700-3 / race SCCL) TaxID=418459 RepID=H6QVP6_PUCGT|nr:uncharacterized protein PGTG_22817 [Puccinia graminis f. sp. tritici CRL 75-36-700-3]EHS63694.1 hypothetical protein PGTG_22817 [Puccinia graminis f. sp. tritici CRL 75-36-700-3]